MPLNLQLVLPLLVIAAIVVYIASRMRSVAPFFDLSFAVADRFDLGRLVPDDEHQLEQLRDFLLPTSGGLRLLVSEWPREISRERGKAVGQGDAFGAGALLFMLGALYSRGLVQEAPSIQSGSTQPTEGRDPWARCNLMLVGGHVSNGATEAIMYHQAANLPYVFDKEEDPHRIVSSLGCLADSYEDPHIPEKHRSKPPDHAYGLVARVPNFFSQDTDHERLAWIFAGCHTWGTFAAVDIFSNWELIQHLCDALDPREPFEAVVRGHWDTDGERAARWPDEVDIVECLAYSDHQWTSILDLLQPQSGSNPRQA